MLPTAAAAPGLLLAGSLKSSPTGLLSRRQRPGLRGGQEPDQLVCAPSLKSPRSRDRDSENLAIRKATGLWKILFPVDDYLK